MLRPSQSGGCSILRPDPVAIYPHCPASAWILPFSLMDLRHVLLAMMRVADFLETVELHLVDDAAIAELNGRHMGAFGPTNVLSFPGCEGMPGSLFLSLDTFARECILYGQRPEIHLLRLLAHGLGHLSGLDHGDEMDKVENSCLEAGMAIL